MHADAVEETRSGYGSERREYSKPSYGGDRDFGGGGTETLFCAMRGHDG